MKDNETVKLYVDDVRPCPEGWLLARTAEEAEKILASREVDLLSLDHDLGDGVKSGYDLCKWMVGENIFPRTIWLHSMNPVGVENMRQLLERYAPKGTYIY